MFSLFVSSLLTIQGVWMLPVKDHSVDLTIAQNNNNLISILTINPNCKRPSRIVLKGNIEKKSCGTSVELYSDFIKVDKNCEVMAVVIACGVLTHQTFKSKTSIISMLKCKGKKTKVITDDVPGVWLRKLKKDANI